MTFSIVARERESGWLGVATATGNVAVGAQVPHARFGIGALASQGFSTNPNYAKLALALLARATPAEEVVAALTSGDSGRGHRQVIVLDAEGRSAGFTGAENFGAKGHLCLEDVALAGNYMAGEAVLAKMRAAYEGAPRETGFGARLLAALAAGQAAGGDIRGTASAALMIDSGGPVPLDLRIDFAEAPVEALVALYARALDPDYQAFLARLPAAAAITED